ncbi:MAG: hypothetical protein ACRC41_14645 [Sarcina sp.]
MNKKIIGIANTVGFVFVLIASVIFSSESFGINQGKPILMPKGYAFSIWLLIYVLLGLFVLRSFFCKEDECKMYRSVVKLFVLCMFSTGITILVELKISVIFIVIATVSAYLIYTKIKKSNVKRRFLIPFSILFSWLLVATFVDISLVLKQTVLSNLKIAQEINISLVVLCVLVLLGILFAVIYSDEIVTLVLIWAVTAVGLNNIDKFPILLLCIGAVIVLLLTFLVIILRKIIKF